MGRREDRETYSCVNNAHLALELQAGLGDVHGERGTLREHGRGASEAELLREARNPAAGISTTHASRHGCCCRRVGCEAEIEPLRTSPPVGREARTFVSNIHSLSKGLIPRKSTRTCVMMIDELSC